METFIQSGPTLKKYTNLELLSGIQHQRGIQEADFQKQFYFRYVNYIYKAATFMCRNFEDPELLAQDVTQETFIKAFKLLPNFSLDPNTPEDEHSYIIKAWLGKIANLCFKRVYTTHIASVHIERELTEVDDVICPLCSDMLIEYRKELKCPKGHYRITRGELVRLEPLTKSLYEKDMFDSLYDNESIEVTSEFRNKLQSAMNTLNEKQKTVLLAYAHEGCLDSKIHLSQRTLDDLCKLYETTPDTIKHIKHRAYEKIKKICFNQ